MSTFSGGHQPLSTSLCIIGGGSAGIGAAMGAARAGADVILVERADRLGGTSANAYVCNWEPGPGDALAREIFLRLHKQGAAGVTTDHNRDRAKGPFGLWLIDPSMTYDDSLRRAGVDPQAWHGVVFDPDAFGRVVAQMLDETGRCRAMMRTSYVDAAAEGDDVKWIDVVSDHGERLRIEAKVFIDCTADALLCRAVGCETMLGPDSASRFGEESAPVEPDTTLNAISLCYRIRKADNAQRQAPPDPTCDAFQRSAHVTQVPGRDRIVNPLALLAGRDLIDMGYESAMAECRRRARAHWHWLQEYPTFATFEFDSFAPQLGIRETYRVLGEYVLTQRDLMAGLDKQRHPDIVAIADHLMDVHGSGAKHVHGMLKGPYGIPYRCLVPKGWANLLVAGRCASFSHIALSSCRLSRTMMALGRAAGVRAATAIRSPGSLTSSATLKEES